MCGWHDTSVSPSSSSLRRRERSLMASMIAYSLASLHPNAADGLYGCRIPWYGSAQPRVENDGSQENESGRHEKSHHTRDNS